MVSPVLVLRLLCSGQYHRHSYLGLDGGGDGIKFEAIIYVIMELVEGDTVYMVINGIGFK